MIYMRCKCGDRTCWTSMGHARCSVCPECGSTLAEGPNGHLDPIPHETLASIVRGELKARCVRCMEERPVEEATNLDEVRKQLRSALEKVPA